MHFVDILEILFSFCKKTLGETQRVLRTLLAFENGNFKPEPGLFSASPTI